MRSVAHFPLFSSTAWWVSSSVDMIWSHLRFPPMATSVASLWMMSLWRRCWLPFLEELLLERTHGLLVHAHAALNARSVLDPDSNAVGGGCRRHLAARTSPFLRPVFGHIEDRGEGCRIPCASRLLPGCLDEISKDTMDKTVGMYVTDVRWWLTF